MPLVFVHGVATRPSAEYKAAVEQRDALFKALVFGRKDVTIVNPDWGSFAAAFGEDLPWLPAPSGNEAFGAGPDNQGEGSSDGLDDRVALGGMAAEDAAQAVDLVVMAALDEKIREAASLGIPEASATDEAISLAVAAADYLEAKGAASGDKPVGVAALATKDNGDFADALEVELEGTGADVEAFGIGDRIRGAIGYLGRLIGNGASDLALRAARRDLSRGVSLFLGDIFVYLRDRDVAGEKGTRERILKPIVAALIKGATAPRDAGEPFVVVGHSLGGVILYDILTDAASLAEIEAAIGAPLAIDALFTVGSQPGFFADLGLYSGGRPAPGTKLKRPGSVASWMNVFDYTDVFSFRAAQVFDDVRDFGYDTVTDLLHAHGSYFLRPSFFKRMRARLQELGHA